MGLSGTFPITFVVLAVQVKYLQGAMPISPSCFAFFHYFGEDKLPHFFLAGGPLVFVFKKLPFWVMLSRVSVLPLGPKTELNSSERCDLSPPPRSTHQHGCLLNDVDDDAAPCHAATSIPSSSGTVW